MAKKGSTSTAKPVDKKGKAPKTDDATEGQSKVKFIVYNIRRATLTISTSGKECPEARNSY
jgi:hypothetical protein